METTQFSSNQPQDSSLFSLRITIGEFLLILLLVNELVLRPLQELFKDHWVYCTARSVVCKGKPVHITPAPRLLRAIGIDNFVSSPHSQPRAQLWMSQLFRIVFLVFLIIAAALFERSVDQQRISTVSLFKTTAITGDSVRVAPGQTTLVSSFPVFGLSEQEARNITAFQSSGTNSSSRYIVRENPVIAAQYSARCVRQVNESYTRAYVGAVVLVNEEQKVMCLDGTGDSKPRIAAQFFSSGTREKAANVKSITLSRLNNENGFSSDSVSGVFAANVTDENNDKYKGYVAVTKRSHFDSNVIWSIYGLMRGEDCFVWRISVRLLWTGDIDCNERPCFDRNPSLDYVGTWTFGEDVYVCPDKKRRLFKRYEQDKIQTASLEMFPASNQTACQKNTDLLAWLVETDYARFVSAEFFEWELRSRVRSDRLFYTTHEGEEILVTDGGVKEMVTMGRTETIIFVTAIVLLLVFILVSLIWSVVQGRRLKMDSEIVSFQAVSSMYRSKHGVKQGSRDVPLEIGLMDTSYGTQRLGLIIDDVACKRRPVVPLD